MPTRALRRGLSTHIAAACAGAAISLLVLGLGHLRAAYLGGPGFGSGVCVTFATFGAGVALPTLLSRLTLRLGWLGQLALLGQLGVLGALVVVRLRLGPAPFLAEGRLWWLLHAATAVGPALIGGLTAGMAISRRPDLVGSLCAATVFGLGAGYLVAPALIWAVGTPTATATSAFWLAVAGTALGARGARARYVTLGLAVGFSIVGVSALLEFPPPRTRSPDGRLETTPGERYASPLYSRWTPDGRIDAVRFEPPRTAGGFGTLGVGAGFHGVPPSYHGVAVDGRMALQLFDWSRGDATQVLFRHHLLATPFLFHDRPKTLTVGPGAGLEARLALSAGASAVDDLEPNAALAHVGWELSPELHPQGSRSVRRMVGEPRSYLATTDTRYDVILINAVQPLADLDGLRGPHALADQLTVEGVERYVAHLTPEGVLAVLLVDPPARSGLPVRATRFAATTRETLRRLGIARPSAHVAVVGAPGAPSVSVTLVKKQPFVPDEVARLTRYADAEAFALWYARGQAVRHPVGLVLDGPGPAAFRYLERAPERLGAVADDRPILFAQPSWSAGVLAAVARGASTGAAVWLVVGLLMWLVVATVGLRTNVAGAAADRGARAVALTYFSATGVGAGVLAVGVLSRIGSLSFASAGESRWLAFAMFAAAAFGAVWAGPRPVRGRAFVYHLVGLVSLATVYVLMWPSLGAMMVDSGPAPRRLIAVALAAVPAVSVGFMLVAGVRGWRGLPSTLHPWALGLFLMGLPLGVMVATTLAERNGHLRTGLVGLTLYTAAALLLASRLSREELGAEPVTDSGTPVPGTSAP